MSTVLSDEQLKLLKDSNKTLAILGRFSHRDDQTTRYIFSNNSGKHGNINVVNLFNELKPELYTSTTGEQVTIGETTFNSYKLTTPLSKESKEDNATSQPILFDSPLLDNSAYSNGEARKMQDQGKQVLQKLLESLDTITYFTQSQFTKSLLKIAGHYLVKEANRNLDKSNETLIAETEQWENTIYSDLSICSLMVQYLTAYEQDESEIETQFKRYLNSLKNDSGESPDSNLYTDKQVDELTIALRKCKQVMLDQSEEDPVWSELATTQSFNWLKDYASSPEYGLTTSQLAQKVGNKKFLAYYDVFIKASNELHRLIRTQAIHPSIFCWLAGKYKEWDTDTATQAARKMYEIGVEGQGEKRIRAESKKELNKYRQDIKEAKIREDLEKKLKDSPVNDSYEVFAEMVEDNIYNVLLPSRVFSRKDLSLRASNLFQVLSQLAGGEVGKILQQNDEFNQLFLKYYRIILNSETNELKQKLIESAEKDHEFNQFEDFQITEFIKSVLQQTTETEEDLKTQVKDAFVNRFAEESKNLFAKNFVDNQYQIQADEIKAKTLYELRSQAQVSSEKQEIGSGAPVYIVSDVTLPNLKHWEHLNSKRQEKLREKTQSAVNSNNSLVTALRTSTLKNIPEGSTAELIKPTGETVGSIKIADAQLQITVEEVQEAEQLKEGEIKLPIKEEGETEEQTLKIADIPEIQEFTTELAAEYKKLDFLKDNYQQLSERMDTILSKYSKEENKPFNRKLRSLLLCEYILAAPKGSTPLGREDTSNILGLMVDIVEHLGEKDNPKIMDGVLTGDPELMSLLEKINLSKYYPADKFEKIATIFQYQRQLCKELNKVQGYLQELAELKNFFEMVRSTDLKIVLINSTLEEHGNIDEIQRCFNIDSPSIVYLTAQSKVTPDSLEITAQSFASLISFPGDGRKLQIPIFVTAQPNLPLQVPLPLISPTNLQLPNFVSEKNGNQDSDIITDWPNEKLAINPYLLLSVAPILADTSVALGNVKSYKFKVNQDMKKRYDLELRSDLTQPVAEVLRKIWLCTNGKVRLVDTLIFTKWLNLLILYTRTDDYTRIDDNQKDPIKMIKDNFGDPLAAKLLNPENSRNSQAAFSTLKELAKLPIKTKPPSGNSWMNPSDMNMAIPITYKYATLLPPKDQTYELELSWVEKFVEKFPDGNK